MRVKCDSNGISQAVNAVRAGKVIIFPTDTVYGMGCDPFDADAVRAVYGLKRRRACKPLPVLGYSGDDLSVIAELGEMHEKITSRFWPGPLTVVTGVRDERIRQSLGLADKIAVRVPRGRCVREILKECRLLVGTSANVSGEKPFVDPQECLQAFGQVPVFVDGGAIAGGVESTIVELDCDGVRILRKGGIAGELLGTP